MRILVYPHDLNMGGSQLNAIDLASAVQRRGHDCVIFGQSGVLNERIEQLGLEFIESPRPGRRPTPKIAQAIRDLVTSRGIDIVHGYEWPPAMEAVLSCMGSGRVQPVCTIMSMAVAPFLPMSLPLVVGTRQIAARERSRGRRDVHVLEPPVDLEYNSVADPAQLSRFRVKYGLDARPVVACVSRLADELKAEGILTAISVARQLARSNPFQLLLVGDGPAREKISLAAAAVNADYPGTVLLTGELVDPRPAYAAADIVLGMGGSALRAMAFEKPLIVQGEKGFFEQLSPETLGTFQWQGWYGVGAGSAEGRARLSSVLIPLLKESSLRGRLGRFSRSVVQDYSLNSAAQKQLEIYEASSSGAPIGRSAGGRELVTSAAKYVNYVAGRALTRIARKNGVDDFNSKPVVATEKDRLPVADMNSLNGPILYFAGANWDAIPGTDRHLAEELSRRGPVLWVDPSQSVLQVPRTGIRVPATSSPMQGLTRLAWYGPPGVSRAGMRTIARWYLGWRVRKFLRSHDIRPRVVICSSSEPLLVAMRRSSALKVYFATDDFVEAARFWRTSGDYLQHAQEANLAEADLVVAVTPELAAQLQRGRRTPIWLPNGTDVDQYRHVEATDAARDVSLREPIAGVVGQFNERTDLAYLTAVHDAGINLLLVGPRAFAFPETERAFDDLVELDGVQWVDRVPRENLPAYLRWMSVGLTPYADTAFNRKSFPLKTMEYLAAGIPVVSTSVPPLDLFDSAFVRGASSPMEFVDEVLGIIRNRPSRADIRASATTHSWSQRASDLLSALEESEAAG